MYHSSTGKVRRSTTATPSAWSSSDSDWTWSGFTSSTSTGSNLYGPLASSTGTVTDYVAAVDVMSMMSSPCSLPDSDSMTNSTMASPSLGSESLSLAENSKNSAIIEVWQLSHGSLLIRHAVTWSKCQSFPKYSGAFGSSTYMSILTWNISLLFVDVNYLVCHFGSWIPNIYEYIDLSGRATRPLNQCMSPVYRSYIHIVVKYSFINEVWQCL